MNTSVSLFTLLAELRVGKAPAGKLEENWRSCRNCRADMFSLQWRQRGFSGAVSVCLQNKTGPWPGAGGRGVQHDAHAQCSKWALLVQNHAGSLLTWCADRVWDCERVRRESLTEATLAACYFPTIGERVPGTFQQPSRLLRPCDSPGKNTGVGCHFLHQGIFPTQGSNPGLPHFRRTLYPLSHQGSPELPSYTFNLKFEVKYIKY